MIEENKSSMKNSVRRLIIAGIGVLIQIIWVVVLVMRLNQYSQIITLLTVAIELVLVLAVYSMDTNAAFKLPWIILITVAPIVGICVFFLFGRSGATKKVRARYRKIDQQLFAYLNQDEQIIEELSKKDERLANDFKYLWKCASSPVYKNTDVKYYGDTCDAMAAQLEDMMQAKKFIFLEYHAIEMAEKLKMLMDIFGKVTFGVLIAAAVFISVFGGFDAQISVKILWQILAVSAVCSVPVLMFDSDASKELSKKGMFARQLLYFIFVNIVVLGLGKLFEWFSFQNFSMVLFMEVLIIAVYAVVNTISYLSDRADAQSMNEKLLEMKKNKKE